MNKRIHSDFRGDERGASMLQFAMTCGMFFMSLTFFFDLMQFGFRSFAAQFIAERAARDVTIGTLGVPNGTCRANRLTNARLLARNRGAVFGFTGLTDANIEVCPLFSTASPNPCRATSSYVKYRSDSASPGEFIEVTVRIPMRLFLFRKTFDVVGYAIGRNEKFKDC